MHRPILPDTDVLIDFFRGVENAVDFVNTHSHRFILSSVKNPQDALSSPDKGGLDR